MSFVVVIFLRVRNRVRTLLSEHYTIVLTMIILTCLDCNRPLSNLGNIDFLGSKRTFKEVCMGIVRVVVYFRREIFSTLN